ncbi:hypothetical protein HNQ93_001723 [Hymenobacter luteus]|uniref:DUF4407 domain-containing protein n=2 Tax=Hymenobacter TaxID=89966 RepID=A0A7W9SZN7_9BACT|nr:MULTISPECIES: DUF4407 domain-containing protein [Hymenobacter]MBB4600916.1 hypothetical protein [Hymenobacter latericoloratus]MBB6058877.1 hypothetical protein [Hymenobacter luteus]
MSTSTHSTSLAATLAAYTPPPAPVSRFMRFFWWCAGANQAFLEKSPTDHIKYGNIGATVVMTSFMAGISMTYALHAVFEATWIAVAMGLVWAGAIFLIDRSIVTSMRKPSRDAKFWSFETWSEIPFVVVRFAVAIVIAFTISKPLEVKIFEKRIAAQISKDKLEEELLAKDAISEINGVEEQKQAVQLANEELKQLEETSKEEPPRQDYQALKSGRVTQVDAFNIISRDNSKQIANNESKIRTTKNRQTRAVKDANGSILGYELTAAGKRIIGDLTRKNKQLKNAIAEKRSAVEVTDREMKRIRTDYESELAVRRGDAMKAKLKRSKAAEAADSATSARQAKNDKILRQSYDTLANGNYPLMTQISALGKLTAANELEIKDKTGKVIEKKATGDEALKYASWLITLLFLSIETAPLLVKLFSKRGPYDDELELAEHLAWVRMQYEKSDINSKINRKLEAINQTDERIKRTVEARQQSMFETSTKSLEKKQELELANNEQLLRLIAEKQLSLADELVKQWYEKEVEKLKPAPAAELPPSPITTPQNTTA